MSLVILVQRPVFRGPWKIHIKRESVKNSSAFVFIWVNDMSDKEFLSFFKCIPNAELNNVALELGIADEFDYTADKSKEERTTAMIRLANVLLDSDLAGAISLRLTSDYDSIGRPPAPLIRPRSIALGTLSAGTCFCLTHTVFYASLLPFMVASTSFLERCFVFPFVTLW